MNIKEYEEHFWVEFDNAVRVEIYTDDNNCGGIGRVKCGRTDVRCDELPVLPLVTTVDGYQVQKVDIEDVQEEGDDCVTVLLRPYLATCGHVDPEAGRVPQWNVGEWNKNPERDRGGELQLTLREVNRDIAGMEMRGFSYAYKFRSRKYHPKCIHYRGTWELGGNATRNEIVVPSQEKCPHKYIKNKKDEFSSSAREGDSLKVQFKHLFSEMQGFTYQYDNHNILVTLFDNPAECQSVIQKEADENYIVQWHQVSDGKSPNGGAMEAPAHEILCADVEADSSEERFNQYHEIKSHLHANLQDKYGIPPQSASIPGFLKREIWHRKDEIQRGLEKLADAGCQEIVLPDLTHQADTKHHHDEGMGSQRMEDLVGETIEAIHKRDLDVGMLVDASALLAHLGDETGDGEYDSVKGWVKHVLDQVEVDALYLAMRSDDAVLQDSDNVECSASVPFEMEVQFHQAVTKAGLRSGSSGFGPFGPVMRSIPFDGISGNEWVYMDTIMEYPYVDVIEGQGNPKDAYFRGLANRLCYGVSFGSDDGERPKLSDWLEHDYCTYNTAFAAVSEYMIHPRQLEEDRGVLWREAEGEGAVQVLWANTEFEVEADEDAHIYDVLRAKQVTLGEELTFQTEEKTVYMLEGDVSLP
ncbi:MAG: hypothetical protein ACOC0A_00335 [Planctomycetota bacterium]